MTCVSIKKALLFLLIVIGGIVLYWNINNWSYENMAEERTASYMKAQGADSEEIIGEASFKNMQGRWEISYKFKDEPDLNYQYTYNRSTDSMLLFVFQTYNDSKLMSGGKTIQEGMEYPSLGADAGWVSFDKDGTPIIEK